MPKTQNCTFLLDGRGRPPLVLDGAAISERWNTSREERKFQIQTTHTSKNTTVGEALE